MKYYILILCFIPLCSIAQSDKSISDKNVPAVILNYIDTHYSSHRTVSYYIDSDDDTINYEADFKCKNTYSLLFDSTGNLIETEIQISFDQTPDSVKSKITNTLKTDFVKCRIVKTETVDHKGNLLYELLVRGKKGKEIVFYEYYFNRSGFFVKVEMINLKSIPSLF